MNKEKLEAALEYANQLVRDALEERVTFMPVHKAMILVAHLVNLAEDYKDDVPIPDTLREL